MASGPIFAQPLDELARLRRRSDPQLAAHAVAQALVDGDRGGAVAGPPEALDQRPVALLGERIELDLLARPAQTGDVVAGRVGQRREPLERVADGLAMTVTRLPGPVLLEAGEQLARAQRERLGELAAFDELVERVQVDPDVVAQADLVTRGEQVARAAGTERGAQRVQRRAQARARAGIEHVRPQARRELRAAVHAGVQRQPAEQRARRP